MYLNGQPLAQIDTGETLTYLHTDHLGTPRYGTDASASQVWAWDSDVFGNGTPTGTITVNLRFPGQYYDAESGLHYNWNRYYNPETGRYVSSDPIGLDGGLNTYLYAEANPVMFVDPEGLTVWTGEMSLTTAADEIIVFSIAVESECKTAIAEVIGYGGERNKRRFTFIDPKKRGFIYKRFIDLSKMAVDYRRFNVEFDDGSSWPSPEHSTFGGYWFYSGGDMVFTAFLYPGVGAVSNNIPLGNKELDGVSFSKVK